MGDPIVIVGLGPAGLVAAIEAAKQGHAVVVVGNQADNQTAQTVELANESLRYLLRLAKTQAYDAETAEHFEAMRELIEDGQSKVIPLKVLTNFLFAQLTNISHFNQTSNLPPVEILAEHQLTDANPHTRLITVADSNGTHQIQFKQLIGADGDSHQTSNLINAHLTAAEQIHYQATPYQLRYANHFAATFNLPANSEVYANSTVRFTETQLTQLKTMGWDKTYPPSIHIYPNPNNKNIYIAGNLPDKIMAMQEPDKALAIADWGKTILAMQTKLPAQVFTVKAPQNNLNLAISSFTTNLVRADKMTITCGKPGDESHFVNIGTAFQSALNLNARINNDINTGRKLAACLRPANRSQEFDTPAFTEALQAQAEILDHQMQQQTWTGHTLTTTEHMQLQLEQQKSTENLSTHLLQIAGLLQASAANAQLWLAQTAASNNLKQIELNKIYQSCFANTQTIATSLQENATAAMAMTQPLNIAKVETDLQQVKLNFEKIEAALEQQQAALGTEWLQQARGKLLVGLLALVGIIPAIIAVVMLRKSDAKTHAATEQFQPIKAAVKAQLAEPLQALQTVKTSAQAMTPNSETPPATPRKPHI